MESDQIAKRLDDIEKWSDRFNQNRNEPGDDPETIKAEILAAFDALREERDVAEVHGKKYHARHGHLLPFDGQACLVCRADALADAAKEHLGGYRSGLLYEALVTYREDV